MDELRKALVALELCRAEGIEIGPHGIYSLRCKRCGATWYHSEEPKHKTDCLQSKIEDALAAHPPEPAEGTGLRERIVRVRDALDAMLEANAPPSQRVILEQINLALTAPASDGGLRERIAGLASHYQGQADNPESPYYARGIWQTVANNLAAALRAQPPKETEQQRQLREKGIPYLQRKLSEPHAFVETADTVREDDLRDTEAKQ